MKTFSCGALVSDCPATFEAATEEELLRMVAKHAAQDHGIDPVPPAMLDQVRASIRDG